METARLTVHCSWPDCKSSITVYRSQGYWGASQRGERGANHAYCDTCREKITALLGRKFRMNGLGKLIKKMREGGEFRNKPSLSMRLLVFVRDEARCKHCIKTLDFAQGSKQWHVDHRTPWALGGKTTLENLQLLCHGCHIAKSKAELKQTRPLAGVPSINRNWQTHYHKDQLITQLQRENTRLLARIAILIDGEEAAG
jgi:hypothetical protein